MSFTCKFRKSSLKACKQPIDRFPLKFLIIFFFRLSEHDRESNIVNADENYGMNQRSEAKVEQINESIHA